MKNYQASLPEFKKTAEESLLPLKVRNLILTYGWNSTSYQIINPGISYWFAGEIEAVVGFVRCNRVRVVVGAPICAEKRLPEIIAEFESEAAQSNEHVCYLAAESRLESVYMERRKYTKVLLGAQPI